MDQLYRKIDKIKEPFFVINSDVICPDPKEQNGTSQETFCRDWGFTLNIMELWKKTRKLTPMPAYLEILSSLKAQSNAVQFEKSPALGPAGTDDDIIDCLGGLDPIIQ